MIQEVRQEIQLKNGYILHTGDVVSVKYKLEKDNKENSYKGKIKYACEAFITLDTSSKYNSSEETICAYTIIDIKKSGDENEKNN
ncbi:hypothetical protein IR152_10520 [Clostridioides sp. ES-S-0108-01]|uniref:hypothetical protein n=1 Tax=Clostridioides sp. ES-S-0108-01 TaxID=2770773 RepID=UPI001D0C4D8A|nr:hypothetical protein [Clostridioides sp. ES-S-0108-01]